MNIYVQVNMPR